MKPSALPLCPRCYENGEVQVELERVNPGVRLPGNPYTVEQRLFCPTCGWRYYGLMRLTFRALLKAAGLVVADVLREPDEEDEGATPRPPPPYRRHRRHA